MIPVFSNQYLNIGFINSILLTFYPQNPVAVIKIEIDSAMRKCLLQTENNMTGCQMVLYIGLEDRNDFHIIYFDRHLLSELVANSALEYKRILLIGYIGYPVIKFAKPV